jgi:hypothetical protein
MPPWGDNVAQKGYRKFTSFTQVADCKYNKKKAINHAVAGGLF